MIDARVWPDGDRQLTPHFRLREFAVSAARPDLARPIPTALVPRVEALATGVLEPLRIALGRPMRILSGYRSDALNKAVGGSPTSQHVVGEAADFTCDSLRSAFTVIAQMIQQGRFVGLGQCIGYPAQNFIHVALASARFPRATLCLHWPERGMTYKVIAPNSVAIDAHWPRA